MLPLLPFRSTAPTGAPLPAEQLTIRLTFVAPNSVELTQSTNFDVSSAPDGTQRAIAALVQWVRQPFPWPDQTSWTQTHAEFSQSVKQLTCRKLNTAGTYERGTSIEPPKQPTLGDVSFPQFEGRSPPPKNAT